LYNTLELIHLCPVLKDYAEIGMLCLFRHNLIQVIRNIEKAYSQKTNEKSFCLLSFFPNL